MSETVDKNLSEFDWRIEQGDCGEVLRSMPDDKVDLCFTSPPYFDAVNYEGHVEKTNGEKDWWERKDQEYGEYLSMIEDSFEALYNTTKEGGICVVNVSPISSDGERYPLMSDLVTIMERIGWDFYDDIIWYKEIARDRRSGVIMQHPYPGYYYTSHTREFVYVFRKPGDKIYEDRTEEEKNRNDIRREDNLDISFDSDEFQNEYADGMWNIKPATPENLDLDEFQEVYDGGLWKIRPVFPENIDHPAPFPTELAERVIKLYSYKGDTVADIFCGSGQTGIAAVHNERNFIGIDKEQEYVEMASRRIEDSLE